MDIKNFTSIPLTRRKFLSLATGALFAAMMPSAEATTLSEFKSGKQVVPDDSETDIKYKIDAKDEDMIGIEKVSVEGIAIYETPLQFVKPLKRRPYTNAIIIHHVGNTDRDINVAAIHRWHQQNGWAGCGYHYIIRKDGTIERGRPLDSIGAHTYKQNDHTIGICIIGNFELARPTHEQFRAAEKLVGALGNVYKITPNERTVFGHKDFCKTDCPGIYLYQWLPDIIRNAKSF